MPRPKSLGPSVPPSTRTDLAGIVFQPDLLFMKRQGESSRKHLPLSPSLLPLTPYLTSVSVSVSVSVPVASSTLYGIGYSSAPKVVKKMPSTLVDSQNSFSCRALVHNKAGLRLSFSLSLSKLGIEWVSR